jgi:hypothetical protein
MGKEIIGDGRAEGTGVLDGTVQVDRVPMDDGGGDEAQAGRTKALVLECPVSNFALAMEKHRTSERVAGLAFVEARVAALAQIWFGEPLQGEQRPFDPPDRAQPALCVFGLGLAQKPVSRSAENAVTFWIKWVQSLRACQVFTARTERLLFGLIV